MNEATVTISVDEYIHLRQSAEISGTIMIELAETRARLNEFDRRIFALEQQGG